MASESKIEWTDSTWNPVTGCSKISPGCKNCYAETFAERFRGVPGHPFEQGFDLRLWPKRIELPLKWREPRMIFVNSMSDLFHKDVPDHFIKSVFDSMENADQHIFQVLTKRPDRMAEWTNRAYIDREIPAHIWLGTSVENQDYVSRIYDLQEAPARVRFLSLEPLLGPIKFKANDLKNIHWAIVGGESGFKARAMDPQWARSIKNQCYEYNVAFFFKQWGAFNSNGQKVGKKHAGRVLDGRTWDEMPVYEKRRESQLVFA